MGNLCSSSSGRRKPNSNYVALQLKKHYEKRNKRITSNKFNNDMLYKDSQSEGCWNEWCVKEDTVATLIWKLEETEENRKFYDEFEQFNFEYFWQTHNHPG